MGALSIFHWFIIGVGFLSVYRLIQRNGAGALAYVVHVHVVTDWHANDKPDPDGVLVRIRGRRAGPIAYVLNLLRIDPMMSFVVDRDSIRFEEGSLSGFSQSVTPVNRVSTCISGYHKPWKSALVIVLVGLVLRSRATFIAEDLFFAEQYLIPLLLFLLVLVVAGIYYALNKRTTLLVRDIGGEARGFAFKQSVIEGKVVSEQQAAIVIRIIENLVLRDASPGQKVHASSATRALSSHSKASNPNQAGIAQPEGEPPC